ncbi:MAG: right-handed parallel beta-helix repeat-containing protein, partial [Thermoanaerobaculia bacterium]|nr:right-handed parallel beta-helix repeat-containing protein [Thermoanaerobaculia bacterium]
MKRYAKPLLTGLCSGLSLLFISALQNLNAQSSPLSGTYTIGGVDPDFATFTAAAAALTARGVSNQVVFDVEPGEYEEKLILSAVSGTSSASTVLFRKKTGAPGEVWLGNDTGAIALSETDFVKFEGMNLGKSLSTGYAVILNYQCTGISFSACQFDLASNSAGIYGYGNFDSLYIGNCGFKGGGYGVHIQGNLTSYNIIIEENLFAGQEIRGIYLHDYYFSSPLIQGNEVISTFPEPNFIAIDVSSASYTKILRNRIRQSAGIGISCNSYGSSTDPTVIANNMVYVYGYSGNTGIALQGDTYMKVFHNSVHCSGQENSAALVFNSGDGNAAYNNILAHSNGGMAVHIFGYVSGIEMDFNNLYTTGDVLGALGYQYYAANLPDWQTLTQQDSHSLSVLPDFYSESNLHIQNPLLDGKGVPLAIVPVDFDGELRDTLTPDMG